MISGLSDQLLLDIALGLGRGPSPFPTGIEGLLETEHEVLLQLGIEDGMPQLVLEVSDFSGSLGEQGIEFV
jgi:hypothetical protein